MVWKTESIETDSQQDSEGSDRRRSSDKYRVRQDATKVLRVRKSQGRDETVARLYRRQKRRSNSKHARDRRDVIERTREMNRITKIGWNVGNYYMIGWRIETLNWSNSPSSVSIQVCHQI